MVPALAGWAITSTGLPCYQHPRRGESGLATVRDDYFSELVIYLSLLAVAENPNLWRQHPAPPLRRDKELLFVPEDFIAPNLRSRRRAATGSEVCACRDFHHGRLRL